MTGLLWGLGGKEAVKFWIWNGIMRVMAGKDPGVMVGTRLRTSPECNCHR